MIVDSKLIDSLISTAIVSAGLISLLRDGKVGTTSFIDNFHRIHARMPYYDDEAIDYHVSVIITHVGNGQDNGRFIERELDIDNMFACIADYATEEQMEMAYDRAKVRIEASGYLVS